MLYSFRYCIIAQKKSMTHIYQMNLHWTSLSTLALFGSPPHTLSGRFLFIVKGAICWTPYSLVLQGHAAAPLEVVLLLLCFYFAKKDKCSKQHKAKTDHSRLGSTVLLLIKEKAISGKSSSFLHVRLMQALCNSDSVSHLEIQCGITLQYGLALPRYHPYFSSCHTIFW